jgi:hypothetical protein
MHIVQQTISSLKLGPPQSTQNLSMVPLLAPSDAPAGYLTLDEALARGYARITEVSDAGSVPELLLVNSGDQPILLFDGEELVGAKQNRTLNLTILAPARSMMTIPVSCVEAGRWRPVSAEFASEGRLFYAAGRARRADHVTGSLRETGTAMSRQGDVWSDISAKSKRLGSRSATEAMASMFDDHRPSLDDFRVAFHAEPLQAGALFFIGGRAAGMDLFDAPATLRRVLPKLVESYALDALDPQLAATPSTQDGADAFMALLGRAKIERFPAIGLGTDLRIDQYGLAGGGLVLDGRLIHLCAFRVGHDAPGERDAGVDLDRRSQRRRH